RPERPQLVRILIDNVPGYANRLAVRPGITGLAQINLPPDETFEDVQRKQVLDRHYIEAANAWLEFRILLATAMRMFGIKGETVMKSMRLCRRHLLPHQEPKLPEAQTVPPPSNMQTDRPSFAFSPESDSGVLL
ncbi:MAG: sugar transferase, partial [Pirellulales bacterium]|nr:sugar transferase [Pirellulales bacterium]